MIISNEMFHRWKSDPVTLQVFEALGKLRAEIEHAMLNSETIFSKDVGTTLARLGGQREMLDVILNVSIDDMEIEGVDDEVEASGA